MRPMVSWDASTIVAKWNWWPTAVVSYSLVAFVTMKWAITILFDMKPRRWSACNVMNDNQPVSTAVIVEFKWQRIIATSANSGMMTRTSRSTIAMIVGFVDKEKDLARISSIAINAIFACPCPWKTDTDALSGIWRAIVRSVANTCSQAQPPSFSW